MNMVVCPHCKSHRIVTSKVPKEVVVVMDCPACHELSVLYRNGVIPLDKRVLEGGSFEERKTHLAGVIARFLEAGPFPFSSEAGEAPEEALDERGPAKEAAPDADKEGEFVPPISDEEFQKFVRIDLKCVDNSAYFRRHFG